MKQATCACLPKSVDGQREATWIVADYIDVVLHIFTPDARDYYRLEDLWGDVPSVEVASPNRRERGGLARCTPCREAARQ